MSDTTLRFSVDLVDRKPVLDHYAPPEGREDECCERYVDAIREHVMTELMMAVCPLVIRQGNVVTLLFAQELSPDEQACVRATVTSISRPGIGIAEIGEEATPA